MLFVHQAPRDSRRNAQTPTRTSNGDARLSSRGRRTPTGTPAVQSGQRRPVSAVRSNAGRASNAQPQHAEEQVAGGSSRPGSASMVGNFGLKTRSPPSSARILGNGQSCAMAAETTAVQGQGGAESPPSNNSRPATPNRSSLNQIRGSQPGSGRVPSVSSAALPLHVMAVGTNGRGTRPQTPTQQRSAPSGGQEDQRNSTSAPSNNDALAAAAGSNSMGNAINAPGNITTVISSALDYKRFLDRRKQMIQQQVESAQQASALRNGNHGEEKPPHGSDGDGPIGNAGTGVTSIGGWMPGATGPLKANHTLAAAANAAQAGESLHTQPPPASPLLLSDPKNPQAGMIARNRRAVANNQGLGQVSPKGSNGDTTGEDSQGSAKDAGTPTSARSCGSSMGNSTATQHVLRRVCQIQDQQLRSSTPTRYTQSAGGVTGASPDCGDGSGRFSRSSLPAGGGRQACRSLGQHAAGDREGFGSRPECSTPEAQPVFFEVPSDVGDSSGRHSSAKRESSLDGLLKDMGGGNDTRAAGTAISGSNVEDYIVGKQIGQGAYATVFFGVHKESSKKVAIKIYEKYKLLDPQRRKSVRCEIRLMERMRHPNVVVFHDALDTAKQIYIVMEFVGGGSLHHVLKKRPGRRLDDQIAKRIFFQVCQGIKYLHDRHVVHRDVKLENLLLDEHGTVKIIDFGFSTIVPPGKKLKIFCGTPSYMAPEIVARKEYSGFCGDIWAMGVLLFALLCGSFPFKGQNDRDLYRKIVKGTFHIPDVVQDGARNLLGRILTPDMTKRPSVDDVLADAWFSSHKDELYTSMRKASSSNVYQPNTSTSSTATTAAPSSSTGQSARETSGELPLARPGSAQGGSGPLRSSLTATAAGPIAQALLHHAASATAGIPSSSSSSGCMVPANAMQSTPAQASAVANPPQVEEIVQDCGSAHPAGLGDDSDSGGRVRGLQPAAERAASERAERPTISSSNARIEEEAISKLERLGYPREEIVRQLRDESSHLCKLYNRFFKALTAWDSKKN